MENIIDEINLYPHPISLNHKNKNMFFSSYGLILSFISYGVMVFLIYYFSYDLLAMKNPKIKINQYEKDNNTMIPLKKILEEVGVNFTLDFNYDEGNFSPNTLFENAFTLYIEYVKESQNEYFWINEFSYRKLNSSLNNYSFEIFMIIDTDTILKNSENTKTPGNSTFKLNEIKLTEIFGLNIEFIFNKPNTIKNYNLKNPEVFYSFSDNTIDTGNYDDFSKSIIYSGILPKNLQIHIMYKVVRFETDKNYFLTRIEKQYIPQIDFFFVNDMEIISQQNEVSFPLIHFKFRQIIDVYNRTYKKILDVLSELGGIFNPLLIVGRILIYSFNEKRFRINLLNNLFTDEEMKFKIDKNESNKDIMESIQRKISLTKNSKNFYENIFKSKLKEAKIGSLKKSDIISNMEMKILSNDLNLKEKILIDNESARSLIKEEDSSMNTPQTRRFIKENSKKLIDSIEKDKFFPTNDFSSNIFSKNHRSFFKNKSKLNKIIEIFEQNKDLLSYRMKSNKKIQQKDQDIKYKISNYLSKQKKQSKLLHYSNKEVAISLFFGRKRLDKNLQKKEVIFDKISTKLDFYFEIKNIIRLYENYEKMKFLLFNNNQRNCFDYMIFDINYNNQHKQEEILYELYNYFQKKNFNNFDKNTDQQIKIILKDEIKRLVIGNQ